MHARTHEQTHKAGKQDLRNKGAVDKQLNAITSVHAREMNPTLNRQQRRPTGIEPALGREAIQVPRAGDLAPSPAVSLVDRKVDHEAVGVCARVCA